MRIVASYELYLFYVRKSLKTFNNPFYINLKVEKLLGTYSSLQSTFQL